MDNRQLTVEIAKLIAAGVVAGIALATYITHSSDQRAAQDRAFQLQAAEVVMAEPNCKRAITKAAELKAIFGDELKTFTTDPFAAVVCYAIEHPKAPRTKFPFFGPHGITTGTTPFKFPTG